MAAKPFPLSFRSAIRNGKFYRLGTDEELTAPSYVKYFTHHSELTNEEFDAMLEKYMKQQETIKELKIFMRNLE